MKSVHIPMPGQPIAFSLDYNGHKLVYRTLSSAVEQSPEDAFGWISEEEKQRAIQTDELWTLRWYPVTPIGFHRLSASTLDALTAYMAVNHGGA